MPHATSLCEKMDDFINIHKAQLVGSGIPERYWECLSHKLKKEVYDAGDIFTIMKVEEVYSDVEDEDGSGSTADLEEEQEVAYSWKVIVTAKGGLRASDSNSVFLVDHAWTYRPDKARSMLETVPGLLPRMAALMDLDAQDKQNEQLIDEVLDEMWRFNQTYKIGNADITTEDAQPVWYVMDEFGSRIQHSDNPSMRAVPFVYVPTQMTYTILWPSQDMDEGDEATRNYVENCRVSGLSRKMMLLPWQPDDMTHLSYEQSEMDESFFMKYKVHESVPLLEQGGPTLPRDRCVTVYTDVDMVQDYLKDPRFELVDNFDDADIIWSSKTFKDFRGFSENTPNKFIDQFPFEMVLTVKDLFSMVSRRCGGRIDPETLETTPAWLQTTFNLHEELPQFVSYFQHRENKELPNYWICKPYNLARSLDMHITSNLSYILRLPDTGPKIACRYVDEPVLFDFEDCGLVKFDLRYVVLLHSVSPLKLSVHRQFLPRFANKPFSLDHFEDYEKHFTVMKYKSLEVKEISTEDFVSKFDEQYPDHPWSKVEEDIFTAIRELFMAASAKPPPKGISPSPQSRAMYGADVMLKWVKGQNGEKKIQPVLLEMSYAPDCLRLCTTNPGFLDQIFSALFLDSFESGKVELL